MLGLSSSEGPQNTKIIAIFWSIHKFYRYSYQKHIHMNQLRTKVQAPGHHHKGQRTKLAEVEAGLQEFVRQDNKR